MVGFARSRSALSARRYNKVFQAVRSQTIVSKRARSAASTFLSRMPRSPQEANAGVPPR